MVKAKPYTVIREFYMRPDQDTILIGPVALVLQTLIRHFVAIILACPRRRFHLSKQVA